MKYLPDRLTAAPPPSKWDHFVEYDAKAWPRRVKREMRLVPTICFNCESACGLLAYVDRDTLQVRKFEENPEHPGSRGRNCAKGPATINQINDPERILYPLKRSGARGAGQLGEHHPRRCFAERDRTDGECPTRGHGALAFLDSGLEHIAWQPEIDRPRPAEFRLPPGARQILA